MKYLIDSADIVEIEKWKNYIDGITTNPKMLKSNFTIEKFYHIFKSFGDIFIQVNNILDVNLNLFNIIYKVPLVLPTIDLLRSLELQGKRTCGTITYDLIQFNLACELGCEFCIVLNAKNETTNFLEDCVEIRDKYNFKTKIIAASFREKKDVVHAIRQGADYATVTPEVMEKCFINEYAMKDYKNFYGAQL